VISLPELLRRFRRGWAPPGAALARVAPPVDVAARLRDEIQPLLDAIGEIQAQADATRAEADERAKALLENAQREADQQVRDAEQRAPATRAEAAERKRSSVDDEITSIVTGGADEARRIAARAEKQLPNLLASVRACVLQGLEQDE